MRLEERLGMYIDIYASLKDRLFMDCVDGRPLWLAEHSTHVAAIAQSIAAQHQQYHMHSDVMYFAGLLHDAGKFLLHPRYICSRCDDLDDINHIQTHPEAGYRFLKTLYDGRIDAVILESVRLHHERGDGRGYPYGLTIEDIPIHVQIVGLSDMYHTLTSMRPYYSSSHIERLQSLDLGSIFSEENLFPRFSLDVIDSFNKARKKVKYKR